MLSMKDALQIKKHKQSKRMEEDIPGKHQPEESWSDYINIDKMDLRKKAVNRDKREYFRMIKVSIHQ